MAFTDTRYQQFAVLAKEESYSIQFPFYRRSTCGLLERVMCCVRFLYAFIQHNKWIEEVQFERNSKRILKTVVSLWFIWLSERSQTEILSESVHMRKQFVGFSLKTHMSRLDSINPPNFNYELSVSLNHPIVNVSWDSSWHPFSGGGALY